LSIIAFSIPLQDIRPWRLDIRRFVRFEGIWAIFALVKSRIVEEGISVCECFGYGCSEEEKKATKCHGGIQIRKCERSGRMDWENERIE
jgi:hypothetical protein